MDTAIDPGFLLFNLKMLTLLNFDIDRLESMGHCCCAQLWRATRYASRKNLRGINIQREHLELFAMFAIVFLVVNVMS